MDIDAHKRASCADGEMDRPPGKRALPPEPSLPCDWDDMLTAWHARRETLFSLLCADVLDMIQHLCGPCQTRDQIDAFDLPLCMMRSQTRQTRVAALVHVSQFPAQLWAAYGLLPTILSDIASVLRPGDASQALVTFQWVLKELGDNLLWDSLLMASDILSVTMSVFTFTANGPGGLDLLFAADLLEALDLFLENTPIDSPGYQPWWNYCRRTLVSSAASRLETAYCFAIVAQRTCRHSLLSRAEWYKLVKDYFCASFHGLAVLVMPGCACLISSHPALAEALTTDRVPMPEAVNFPRDWCGGVGDGHVNCREASRKAHLQMINCAAKHLGQAQEYVDCLDTMQCIVGQFRIPSLIRDTAIALVSITCCADVTAFVADEWWATFVSVLMRHLSTCPSLIVSILFNCLVDGHTQALRVFVHPNNNDQYVDQLLPYLTCSDARVAQDVAWILQEIQGLFFAQFLRVVRPFVSACHQQQKKTYHQEHDLSLTTTRSVLECTRFATQTLTDYLDEALAADHE